MLISEYNANIGLQDEVMTSLSEVKNIICLDYELHMIASDITDHVLISFYVSVRCVVGKVSLDLYFVNA